MESKELAQWMERRGVGQTLRAWVSNELLGRRNYSDLEGLVSDGVATIQVKLSDPGKLKITKAITYEAELKTANESIKTLEEEFKNAENELKKTKKTVTNQEKEIEDLTAQLEVAKVTKKKTPKVTVNVPSIDPRRPQDEDS